MLGYHMALLEGLNTLDQRSFSYPGARSHVACNDANTTQTNRRTNEYCPECEVCVCRKFRYLKEEPAQEPAELHGTERGRLVCLHFVHICRVC